MRKVATVDIVFMPIVRFVHFIRFAPVHAVVTEFDDRKAVFGGVRFPMRADGTEGELRLEDVGLFRGKTEPLAGKNLGEVPSADFRTVNFTILSARMRGTEQCWS